MVCSGLLNHRLHRLHGLGEEVLPRARGGRSGGLPELLTADCADLEGKALRFDSVRNLHSSTTHRALEAGASRSPVLSASSASLRFNSENRRDDDHPVENHASGSRSEVGVNCDKIWTGPLPSGRMMLEPVGPVLRERAHGNCAGTAFRPFLNLS